MSKKQIQNIKSAAELYADDQIIPKHLKVFFVEKDGLSSSEASHQSNLIKERCEKINKEFERTDAFNEVMPDFKGKVTALDNNEVVEELAEKAMQEGKLYALSAWFKEAIKAREALFNFISNIEHFDDITDPVMEIQAPMMAYPTRQNWTEEDIIGEWSVKERAEYLAEEAICAHLGKKIHQGGKLSEIRRKLLQGPKNTFKELGKGTSADVYVVTQKPLYQADWFEEVFFKLQAEYRAHAQKLNYLKGKIKDEVSNRNAAAEDAYKQAYKEASNEYNVKLAEYNIARKEYELAQTVNLSEISARKSRLRNYVSKLKIVVPNDLAYILEEIKNK